MAAGQFRYCVPRKVNPYCVVALLPDAIQYMEYTLSIDRIAIYLSEEQMRLCILDAKSIDNTVVIC